MTNLDIRELAMKKRKNKRFIGIIFAWFFLNAALVSPMFFAMPPGAGVKLALDQMICVVAGLIASTGLARASVAEWCGSGARYADLFAVFQSGRRFLRGMVVAVLAQLPTVCVRILQTFTDSVSADASYRTIVWIAVMVLSILLMFASMCMGTLFYAIELLPEEPLRALLPRCFFRALRNIWRFISITIVTAWVPVLLFFFYFIFAWMMTVQLASLLTYALVAGGFIALLIATVRVYGTYIALSFAGLAAEVFEDAARKEVSA